MPKIYDCFIFFNELDILEIRLNELDPVVDQFVLCEAPVTFKGKSKPLYFEQNKDRFAPFLHKITHIVVDDMPNGPDGKAVFWKRQKFQRNALSRGLVDAKPDDFIILSDLDEIPRASVLANIVRDCDAPKVFCFDMRDHRFFVNLARSHPWNHSRMARFGDIRKMERLRGGGPTWWPEHRSFLHTMRQWKRMSFGMRRLRPWTRIPEAGWHFSYMGGPDRVSYKLNAVSAMRPKNETSTDAVAGRITKILSDASKAIDRKGYRLRELDISFPKYLIENQDRFSHLIADRRTFEQFGVMPPPSMT